MNYPDKMYCVSHSNPGMSRQHMLLYIRANELGYAAHSTDFHVLADEEGRRRAVEAIKAGKNVYNERLDPVTVEELENGKW